jgi:hypothetical protein
VALNYEDQVKLSPSIYVHKIYVCNANINFSLQEQKCLRKCSSDEDCKSKKKKCMCDGACGMSCVKPGRNSTAQSLILLIKYDLK